MSSSYLDQFRQARGAEKTALWRAHRREIVAEHNALRITPRAKPKPKQTDAPADAHTAATATWERMGKPLVTVRNSAPLPIPGLNADDMAFLRHQDEQLRRLTA